MSRWNRYLERKLDLDLTVEEHRLVDAIARSTLGYQKLTEHLGDGLLRERARLHGRSFTRARDGLADKSLIRFTPPTKPAPGRRTFYEILLDEPPAQERVVEKKELPAVERVEPPAELPAELPAPERGRIEERGKKNYSAAVLPPPARERGGGEDDDVVLEGDVVREPVEFKEKVEPLGLTEAQRRTAVAAFNEDREGFFRVLQEARREGRKPASLFISKLERGDHLGNGGSLSVTGADVLARTRGDTQEPVESVPALPDGWLPNPPAGVCVDCGDEDVALVDAIRCADCARHQKGKS